jgi:hypothetical protein
VDSSNFGASVGTAGDLDGDGYDDIIVGAPGFDGGLTDQGRAYVYRGSESGVTTAGGWLASGDQIGAQFGHSVGTAGDVNGDGYDDVLVGALRYDNGETDEGRAYVFHGSPSGPGAVAYWTAEGDQESALFGSAVATAGDVDGDGYDDVLVGAYLYDGGVRDQGRSYLFYGAPGPDCDEGDVYCTSDCTTDVDTDSTRDCSDACIDVDGDGYGDTGGPIPATCTGADCDDANAHCTADCTDGDTDGYCDPHDCAAADDQLWSTPGEVRELTWPDDTTLAWGTPDHPGCVTPIYDSIRSAEASDFTTGATCLESDDGSNTWAIEPDSPATGSAWFYLVRAENGCGLGPAGWDSDGGTRSARDCP